MKKHNFVNFVMIVVLTLVCVCTTGCGAAEKAAETANQAKETVVTTASNAKESASWWTRKTESQSWTNSTGTKIEIKERRKEGDFEVKVTYSKETLNTDNREGVTPTGDATIILYVDHISEELMDELQTY